MLDGPDGVQQLLDDHRVVDIGRREHHRERDASPVDHKVALRAPFPLIRRIRSGLLAPLCRDGSRVQRSALPVDLLGPSETVQQNREKALPHARLLPFLEAAPASYPACAAHLLGEHLPGYAAL
jgi:hypothetical protein